MKTIKHITRLCALSAFMANAWAGTTSIIADGTTVTLQDDDTVVTTGAGSAYYGLNATNAGNISVANPDSDSIQISVSGSGTRAVSAYSGSTINIGTGSTITSELGGVLVANASSISGNSLTLKQENTASNSTGIGASTGASINVGANTSFTYKGGYRGISIATNASFTATEGFTYVSYEKSSGNNIDIYAERGGNIDLGKNASITSQAVRALYVLGENSSLRAEDSVIVNTFGMGAQAGAESSITLINTSVTAEKAALAISTATGGTYTGDATLNIIGGDYYSETDSVIFVQGGGTSNVNAVVNIDDGAILNSANGTMIDTSDVTIITSTMIAINVSGENTSIGGRVLDNTNVVTLSVSDNATWTSEGSSNIDKLVLDNANIVLTLTEQGDAINVGEMSTSGSNDILIDFGNDFLNEITDGFMFDTDTAIIIGSGEKDNINYIITDHNKDGSTWDVTDNLDGTYTISNINVVPEPATYAVIFGALALALVAYRRRK